MPADIEAEYQRYAALNLTVSGDFWAGGFILRMPRQRASGKVQQRALDAREFLRGSSNDQFSLYFALSTMIPAKA